MYKTNFTIPLWERDVVLIIGGTTEDILKVAKDNKLSAPVIEEIKRDGAGPTLGTAYFCLERGIGIIQFPKKRVAKGVLAHEATHIVDWLLEFIGADTEMEARAYTTEWLVTNIPLLIKKMGVKFPHKKSK